MAVKTDMKKEPEVVVVSDNEFELMFAQESGVSLEAVVVPEEDGPAEEVKEAATVEPVEPVEKVDPPVEIDPPAKKVEAPVGKAKKAEKAAPTAEEVAEKQRLSDEKKQKDEALTTRATLADDEKALAAEVHKDFPDVSKVIEIQQRIADAKWEQRFEAFQKNLTDQLAPAMQTINVVASDAFERAVYGKHPDTPTILPDVEKWVDAQPTFLRAAYNKVLDTGTAAETIELLDVYKTATGKSEVKEDPGVAAEKERKLTSQEGVRSRQAPKKELAPTDFEGAFEKEAARAVA